MTKKEFGPQPWLFPCPTVLIGTSCDGKTNFAPYAWCGITGGDPPTLSVAVRHQRHTLKGILENKTFSVNIPSVDMVRETDYCGLVSGAQVDKAEECGFKVLFGLLPTTPLIEACPVNLECEVMHLLNLGLHMLVVGKIVQTHVSEDCLTDGQPDITKIKPIIYSRGPAARYNAVGEVIGEAFSIGKGMKGRNSKS